MASWAPTRLFTGPDARALVRLILVTDKLAEEIEPEIEIDTKAISWKNS